MDKQSNSGTPQTPQLGQDFWEAHWQNEDTGWDIGYPSPALVDFMKQYPDKDASILIAGCGNAYEAEWLLQNGFRRITLVDIAPKAVARLKEKFASAKGIQVHCEDFFLHRGQYDLMLEQTFFCAIPPQRRPEYVAQAAALLRPGAMIAGLLFDKTFEKPGPPFGGSAAEYQALFEPLFQIQKLDACTRSIPPRAGSELFFQFAKK